MEVTCPGCSATFQSHLKSVVFCSERCRVCSWALRPPRSCCFVCGAWLRWGDAISRGLTNEEFWQEQAAFPDQHRACVVEDLDRVLGRERLVCRCESCRLERGEVVESKPKRPRRNRPASTLTYVRNRAVVLERDGWTCQICGLPLDREASVIDDLYPQVDHILSVAWGGGDELENLRAAHRWCNLALSDGFERGHEEDAVRDAARNRFSDRYPPGDSE